MEFTFGFIKCQITAACLGTLLEYGPAAHNNLPDKWRLPGMVRLTHEPCHIAVYLSYGFCHFQRFSSCVSIFSALAVLR